MITTTPRTARRARNCESCLALIRVRDRYLEHVASPDHDDLGNVTWWRLAECAECAVRYGRGPLLEKTNGPVEGGGSDG